MLPQTPGQAPRPQHDQNPPGHTSPSSVPEVTNPGVNIPAPPNSPARENTDDRRSLSHMRRHRRILDFNPDMNITATVPAAAAPSTVAGYGFVIYLFEQEVA
ncbi:hypothetical protein FRC04_005064 [Tulasnella sp. 424]|nr:hypothetical protein FRC04_005064 [Tulasnella sp. 424]KAG8962902.1 hypothetical protein FRC05_005072 [Tulasnella sp. 425]